MHSYSINTNERRNILFILAFLSIAISQLLSLIPIFQYGWITVPKSFAIYGVLCFVFNKWAWVWFSKAKIISTPFLDGEWEAFINSTFNQSNTTPARLIISQSWTKVCFRLESEYSTSSSTGASINIDEDGSYSVTYHYVNKPKNSSPSTMTMHEGTNHIRISKDKRIFSGHYFTSRDRGNYGDISFKRLPKNA